MHRRRELDTRSSSIAAQKALLIVALFSVVLLAACGAQGSNGTPSLPQQPVLSNSIGVHAEKQDNSGASEPLTLAPHGVTPTPKPTIKPTQAPPANAGPLPIGPPKGAAPYGAPPPLTSLESQLTQNLFALINSDRAARGLYPYTWNATLAGGARLHSWNMYHCGFSHTCPDGLQPCTRIMNYGFPNQPVCGENIGYAGPYPNAWEGTRKIQESMANEPPTGIHFEQLFSTQFHIVGVGVYVAPDGFIWFTEDIL